MKIDILTIFPDFFRGPLDYGIVRRARETGLVEIGIHDLRDFTKDKHRTVDDRPFGGGEGMVLKPEPIFECLESLGGIARRDERLDAGTLRQSVILLSAQGGRWTSRWLPNLSALERMVLICGRYEGVDERVSEHLGGSRNFGRRLCAERWRTRRGGDRGYGHAVDSRRGRQCGIDAAGVVYGGRRACERRRLA